MVIFEKGLFILFYSMYRSLRMNGGGWQIQLSFLSRVSIFLRCMSKAIRELDCTWPVRSCNWLLDFWTLTRRKGGSFTLPALSSVFGSTHLQGNFLVLPQPILTGSCWQVFKKTQTQGGVVLSFQASRQKSIMEIELYRKLSLAPSSPRQLLFRVLVLFLI